MIKLCWSLLAIYVNCLQQIHWCEILAIHLLLLGDGVILGGAELSSEEGEEVDDSDGDADFSEYTSDGSFFNTIF